MGGGGDRCYAVAVHVPTTVVPDAAAAGDVGENDSEFVLLLVAAAAADLRRHETKTIDNSVFREQGPMIQIFVAT